MNSVTSTCVIASAFVLGIFVAPKLKVFGKEQTEKSIMKDNEHPSSLKRKDRVQGSLLGALIADALSFPLHWYYNLNVLAEHKKRLYGDSDVRTYMAVPDDHVHPDAPRFSRFIDPSKLPFDIFHDHKPLLDVAGTHWHKTLAAGESTVTGGLIRLLLRTVVDAGNRYDRKEYITAYKNFFFET
eukprot:Rmarinus@m.14262